MLHDTIAATARARRIDLLAGDDFQCAILGSLGFSTRFIRERTGLTPGQVAYRLRKGEIRRQDYRNGESQLAGRMLKQARQVAESHVHSHIRNVLDTR